MTFDATGHWSPAPIPWPRAAEAGPAAAVLRVALDSLPPLEREVVFLRDVRGRTTEEICAKLGLDPSVARTLLHRGRTALHAALSRHLSG